MTHRILMIDDNRDMMIRGRSILEGEGLEVLSGYGSEEGLEILNQESNIDLILLDTRMNCMYGWQVLRTLKNSEKYAQIPIIMLTIQHYLKDDYLIKACTTLLHKHCTSSSLGT